VSETKPAYRGSTAAARAALRHAAMHIAGYIGVFGQYDMGKAGRSRMTVSNPC